MSDATLPPDWLPEMLDVNGAPSEVFADLYVVFRLDFIDAPCLFRSCRVWFNQTILPDDDKEEGFWHLVTRENHGSGARLLDPRRAECLPWCAALLCNEAAPEVTVWDYMEGSGKRQTYLWLHDWDYLVILHRRTIKGKRGDFDIFFLVTAFYVDQYKRADLENRYKNRVG